MLEMTLIAIMVLDGEYIGATLHISFYFLVSAILYNRFIRGRKPKYPLSPPGREWDPYFPRSNIPRPIHEDVREHPEFFKKKEKREEPYES